MNEKDITASGMQFALELMKLCEKYGVILVAEKNFYDESMVSVGLQLPPHDNFLDFSYVTGDHIEYLLSARTSCMKYNRESKDRIFRRYSEVAK